ncbi:tRNA (adenosine(37)-N6)-threonylcarbamoyltransferase complex dimerization subunit type 1 TsaB [Arhodomonas aquaeolei]|uniref:tRNA (adenosine(37)-N6)-threonylcarbamoyltransferase complex dimerization subunit type 1 TsaB n=1 Tax=Arhodomonas aquaeolei TaxID=2369 RepID=UPI0021685977|nr:tRNA (adenosine(37)-N6)-threonylcarbamoyltransferase complex dimerization subunit type 1 TsaB [Arhodomonas aquaeolei]MCS4503164.1 tRNA (adenosine(37)-N6)-threonylcarbamoyltransferase complex dimerization subunit type 1 TsaB [Arhodomonas aquaeolei]
MSGLLAIDTTTTACSVALRAGKAVLCRYEAVGQGHSRTVLAMVRAVLDEAGLEMTDLGALVCCSGPGSFTGVRIGIGVTQGLALGADLPVIPVSTLATVAQGACRTHGAAAVAVAMDARMGEVYWGCYRRRGAGVVTAGEEAVVSPDSVVLPGTGDAWLGCGTGYGAYAEVLAERLGEAVTVVDPERLPDARDCLALAEVRLAAGARGVAAEDVVPTYLRNRVTQG